MPFQPLDHEEIFGDFLRRDDPGGGETLEIPIRRRSIAMFFLGVFALLSFFEFRTFSLTVLRGSAFENLAERSRERLSTIEAMRGAILDQNGVVLVENEPSFQLIFDPLAARSVSKEEEEHAFKRIADITGTNAEELKAAIAPFRNQAEPRVLLADLPKEAAIAIAGEDRSFLRVEATFRRSYPRGGELFAPVVGYIGAVTEDDLRTNNGYSPHDRIGKAGVEESYERELRGTPGVRRTIVDASGNPQGETIVVNPVAGATLRLTIDADLTEVAGAALRRAMQSSHSSGGAVVALDPRNGAVRALVSLPSYDPASSFTKETFGRLVADERKPFLNRAISGLYPSGSTIKPFIAAAALAERIISPSRRIDTSRGFITVNSIYDPNVSWTFRDWKPHGLVNIVDALAVSADIYFYTVGGGYGDISGLGPSRIARYLHDFGFGKTLGIDLPGEASGLVPTPEWKKETIGEQWYIGDTYHLSIGQGAFAVTPLQLASATAVVANDGALYRPHVLDALIDAEGREIRHVEPQRLGTIPVSSADLAIVRKGMRASVTSPHGTNRALADLPITVAAKTGTAQFGEGKKTHALVTAFAPFEHPTIVLAIILEGGGEGTVATAVAKDILSWYATHRSK